MKPIITLLTDFGTSDTYVAQMKGLLLARCPDCQLVDVTHQVPPQDVRSGARMLGEVLSCFPPKSTHVAIVDPGVGTSRRILAVRVGDQSVVLPDNGLITEVWNWANKLEQSLRSQAWHVTNSKLWRQTVSSTFHGRDIISPVAAFLASGGDIQQVGPAVDSVELLEPIPDAELSLDGFGKLQVVSIDHFGNVCLNGPKQFVQRILELGSQPGESLEATLHFHSAVGPSVNNQGQARVVSTYGQAKPGEVVILLDSQGRLELAVVNGSAADCLGLTTQSVVELRIL